MTTVQIHMFELQPGDVIPHEGRDATVVSVSAPHPHGLGKMHFVDILLNVDGVEVWFSPDANQLTEYARFQTMEGETNVTPHPQTQTTARSSGRHRNK